MTFMNNIKIKLNNLLILEQQEQKINQEKLNAFLCKKMPKFDKYIKRLNILAWLKVAKFVIFMLVSLIVFFIYVVSVFQ